MMISDHKNNNVKGRPADYTSELGDAVIERLLEDESLRAICADHGMPDRDTINRWVAQHEDFRKSYQFAQSLLWQMLQEDIFHIVDDSGGDWVEKVRWGRRVVRVRDPKHLSRCRLRAEAREWVLDQRMGNNPVNSRRRRQK